MTDEKKNELVDTSTLIVDLTGRSSGALKGFSIGGPAGAVGGAISGVLIQYGLRAVVPIFTKGFASPRERLRIATVLIIANEKINENLKQGRKIRGDGFFTPGIDERSPSEEIMEGVLRAAQKEYEEKKIVYIGNLLANLAFEEEVSRGDANRLIREAEQLSYRQLCILSLGKNKERYALRKTDYRGGGQFSFSLMVAMEDMSDVCTRGMINFGGEALLGITDVNPGKMALQSTGNALYTLMELSEIRREDLEELAALLH